jgi:ribonuclease Z
MRGEGQMSMTKWNPLFDLSLVMLLMCLLAGHALAESDTDEKRSNYYPNTEALAADEMRITALGTGTPNFRRSQASASWLVELGNGQKFIFDIGTGSLANLAALEIAGSRIGPYR